MISSSEPVRGEEPPLPPEPPAFSRIWPHLAQLVAHGGEFRIGPFRHHVVCATASNHRGAVASAVLRAHESLPELMMRLERATERVHAPSADMDEVNEAGVPLFGLARARGRRR